MANLRFFFFLLVSLVFSIGAKPVSEDKVTANDVHLNTVLPESDTTPKTVKIVDDQQSLPSADAPANLELQNEDDITTKAPTFESPVYVPGNAHPTYFSRVITSIFEIPIAVLTAVRNLLQTTAHPKLPPPS